MPDRLKPPLIPGDYIFDFHLRSTMGGELTPNSLVGRPLVVFFYSADGERESNCAICGFRDSHAEFEKLGVVIIGIAICQSESQKRFAEARQIPFPLLSDMGGATSAKYGVLRPVMVEGKPAVAVAATTYLIGKDFRIVKTYCDAAAEDHPARVLEDCKWMLREQPLPFIRHAPVLILENVIPPELCKTLIGLWESESEESGFMKQVDGKTVGITDHSHKIRRDHYVQPGEVCNALQRCLAANVVIEIGKAFHFNVTRREDFRVACYDARRGGYFRPHRDNTTEGTSHRRFAMSLLLNDDYEGGYLRFPEYGPHLYRPRAGGAVVFSCSLLHEATDVTAGRRFVLLSFFYGEAEAKAREQYERKVGGQYRA